MTESYMTVRQAGHNEVTIQKSRFIGYASPCTTEEEAIRYIQAIREQHREARHHCYAYIIGSNSGIMRYSDDGEPGGTAGMPVLNVFRNEEIFNVTCVVTRYFGGTLLGAGGLVRAYGKAAKMALDALRDEAEKEAKKQGVALATPAAKLREYAICHKMSSPSYKDLGESENSTAAKRIFVVECSFSKFCERGYGETKATAKSDAVSKVLEKLRLETKSAKKSAKNSTNQKSVQDKAPVQRKKTKAKKAPTATKK